MPDEQKSLSKRQAAAATQALWLRNHPRVAAALILIVGWGLSFSEYSEVLGDAQLGMPKVDFSSAKCAFCVGMGMLGLVYLIGGRRLVVATEGNNAFRAALVVLFVGAAVGSDLWFKHQLSTLGYR